MMEDAFQYTATPKQLETYYNKLSNDFTDEELGMVIDLILETAFRFPAISDFYKCLPDLKKDGVKVWTEAEKKAFTESRRVSM